jgi:hypothetical protein
VHKLTITISGGGCGVKHHVEFRPPCLAAPSWLMTESMIISFPQVEEGTDIPILGYIRGTGLGIPNDAARGILVDGRPVSEVDYILVILMPRDEGGFLARAVLKDGAGTTSEQVMFEEVFDGSDDMQQHDGGYEHITGLLAKAVGRAEVMELKVP